MSTGKTSGGAKPQTIISAIKKRPVPRKGRSAQSPCYHPNSRRKHTDRHSLAHFHDCRRYRLHTRVFARFPDTTPKRIFKNSLTAAAHSPMTSALFRRTCFLLDFFIVFIVINMYLIFYHSILYFSIVNLPFLINIL